MKRKILSAILSICLILTTLSINFAVNAEETNTTYEAPSIPTTGDVWDGTTLQPTKLVAMDGIYYYEITKCSELAYIAETGGDWCDYNYILGNNLILNDVAIEWNDNDECINSNLKEWKPIDNFTGIFDGNNFKISGVYINNIEKNNVGLFGTINAPIGTTTAIKNLVVVNAFIVGNENVGGIVGDFDAYWNNEIAGMQNCIFSGYVCAYSNTAGGIMGDSNGAGFSDLTNYGIIKSNSIAGGISGGIADLNKCYNYGNISYKQGNDETDYPGEMFGGIAAVSADYTYCVNYGNVIGKKYVGGIFGYADGGTTTLSCCENKGDVTGETNIGGIAGSSNDDEVNRSKNSGFVTGDTNVGGVVGYREKGWYPATYDVVDVYNVGTVSGKNYVAGIIGYAEDGTYIANAYNIGSVQSTGIAGALLCADNYKWGKTYAYDCFYEKAKTPNLFGCGYQGVDSDSGGIQSKTATELKSIDTYPTEEYEVGGYYYGWSINEKYWGNGDYGWKLVDNFNDGYPCLTWEYNNAPIYGDITGITFNDAEYTYDGTEKEIKIIGELPDGANVVYKSNKGTAAGTFNATAKITCAGYNEKTLKATLKINPKKLTITGLSAQNKVYDGTDKAELSGGTLTGVISGDDVSANIPTEGKFSDKNVGNGKKVTIDDIELNGDDKNNYTLTQRTDLKANITKASVSVKAKNKTMKVGETLPTFDYEKIGLLEGDTITGSLKTTTDGKTEGTFDIVEDEKFNAGSNYDVTFTKGTLTVSKKDNQKVNVSDISTTKTYGDAPFTFTITDNEKNVIGDIEVTSSKPDVATVENSNGTVTVTIKKAGTTEIRVFRKGNENYADFDEKTTLTVGKKTLKIKAKSDTVKQSDTLTLPTLDNTWWTLDESTPLVPGDAINGTLKYADNATRKTIGTYAIEKGDLFAGENYTIEFTDGTMTVEPKTEQTITITGLETKIYGEGTFEISATSTSGLAEFTYTSDNTDVATIDGNGRITIVGAGKANISVTQAGNDEYASKTETAELNVNKRNVTVTSVDVANKSAVLDGVLETDKETAILDFDKITLTIGDSVDETTSNAVLTNFVLKGDKAENYIITTESFDTTIANDNVVTVTITAENGTATGAAKYLKNSNVTVTATANSGYKFDGWYNGDTSVSTNASYTFKAESDVTLVAKFSRKSTGGGGGGGGSVSSYTVKFETNGGSNVESVKVDKNKTVTEPTAPTKDGFEFAGWYTDKDLKTKYDFSEKVTKSLTLYAAWTEKKAEVKDDQTEPTTPENKITFTDVAGNEWFADNVKYVFENGLMNGVTNTEFAPNDNLTRAMLVAILYRAEGEPAVNKSIPFADVKADDYFANAVIWAQQNGIVSGVSENEFAPNENITREQIAAIIYRYANYKGYDTSTKADISAYADYAEISEYAVEAMQYAVVNGLIKGKTETTLNPKDNATRAEIAAILQRFIESNK